METYIILGNLTEQGVKTMKDLPGRVEAAKAATEKAGGKWLGYWLTMGQYDFVVMAEGIDAVTAATVVLATSMQGNVRTETLRAFTFDEAKGIVANLP